MNAKNISKFFKNFLLTNFFIKRMLIMAKGIKRHYMPCTPIININNVADLPTSI